MMMRRRGRPLVRAAATTAVVAGTAGAVRHHQEQKYASQAAQQQAVYEQGVADAQVPGGDYSEEALDIGLMIKPELTGQGLGTGFVANIVHHAIETYKPAKLRVTILESNKRAMRVWEKNGLQKEQSFKRESDNTAFFIFTKYV